MSVLNVAREIAEDAGRELLDGLPNPRNISTKGSEEDAGTNLVTEMDKHAESRITDRLSAAFPEHDFVAEEGTERTEGSRYRWLIDPLDGTSNYAHAFPWFAVSLALQERSPDAPSDPPYETVLGVVRIPFSDETFYAERDEGAYRNDESLRVSDRSPLSDCMVATGFPYTRRTTDLPLYRDFENMTRSTRSIRRAGTASIDLCYLAAGVFDGFWEWHLQPWDTAAGTLMIREAGGQTTDFQGHPHDPYGDQTLASNGSIHEEMKQVLSTGEPICP